MATVAARLPENAVPRLSRTPPRITAFVAENGRSTRLLRHTSHQKRPGAGRTDEPAERLFHR